MSLHGFWLAFACWLARTETLQPPWPNMCLDLHARLTVAQILTGLLYSCAQVAFFLGGQLVSLSLAVSRGRRKHAPLGSSDIRTARVTERLDRYLYLTYWAWKK